MEAKPVNKTKKENGKMEIYPVGKVHCEKTISRIEIYPEYSEGLKNIEKSGRLQIIYWMHKLPCYDRKKLQVYPRGNTARPLTGVFALRSPMRPNPMGITDVNMIKREGNNLFVEGLDAFDGSPVLDVKAAR
jgi:tRNA (adenine37-N6)-methyltransferase